MNIIIIPSMISTHFFCFIRLISIYTLVCYNKLLLLTFIMFAFPQYVLKFTPTCSRKHSAVYYIEIDLCQTQRVKYVSASYAMSVVLNWQNSSYRTKIHNILTWKDFSELIKTYLKTFARNKSQRWAICNNRLCIQLFVGGLRYLCPAHILLWFWFVFLLLLYHILPVSLDFSFLIALSVFSNCLFSNSTMFITILRTYN